MIIETYSVLLLTTYDAAVACGFYAVHCSMTHLSRLFLTICTTLAVWAFGSALTGAVRTRETYSVGRRIAPLDWGITGSLAMHAILLLTGRGGPLEKRWLFFLIYLPAAVSVCAYTVLLLFDRNPDMLVHMEHGWVNVSETDGWDWFYYIYIVLYTVMIVVLLLQWGRHSTSNDEKKQAKIIPFSLFFAAMLEYITDVLSVFLHTRFPQVAVAFALMMILVVGYYINRYHFLQPIAIGQNEMIPSKSVRANIYLYLGLMLFIGACPLLTDRSFYTGRQNAIPVQVVSGLLVLLDTFLALIERLRSEDSAKEMLVSLPLALMIPFYMLWLTDEGIFIAWSFAFLFMIVCLLLNRPITLSTVIVTASLTQLFAWDYVPPEVIALFGKYYLDRMGVVAFAATFAMYVDKIYTTRLQESINHATMQSVVSDISHSFASSSEMNIDQKLYAALEECGRFIEYDRACLALMNMQTNTVRYAVERMSGAADLPRGTLSDAIQNIRSEMFRRLQDDEALMLKDVLFLPTETAKVRA